MSEMNQQLREVEMSIEEAREQVELYEAFMRLKDNKDFDKLIRENFLEKEAHRAVGAKAEIGMLMNEVGMQMLDNIIVSIGGLRQYFLKIQTQGRNAAQAIADDQETHAEILAEQAASEE